MGQNFSLIKERVYSVPDDEVNHVMLPRKDDWMFSITVDGSLT